MRAPHGRVVTLVRESLSEGHRDEWILASSSERSFPVRCVNLHAMH